MLFNAPAFLFGFLPAVLLGTAVAAHIGGRAIAVAWLTLASLVFYGWDQPRRLFAILLCSILFNFLVGRALTRQPHQGILAFGVGANLTALAWFKYAGFGSATLLALGLPVAVRHVSLPIGISFFTFTQIAYLVDAYWGDARRYRLLDYTLFVSFFPHLVAGPILRHRDIVPQFDRADAFRVNSQYVALALIWFVAGLFKKVVLADSMAPAVDRVFGMAGSGVAIAGATRGSAPLAMRCSSISTFPAIPTWQPGWH